MTGVLLRDHIHWCCTDGTIVILDSVSGQYHALSPPQSGLWLTLFSTGADLGVLCDRSDSDAVGKFILSLRQRNWVVDASAGDAIRTALPTAPQRACAPAALDAFYCLARLTWTLRFRGFQGAYDWAQSYATLIDCDAASAETPAAFEAATAAFNQAERFVISSRGLDDCLPRSLAFFVYLRRRGFDAQHIIGIKRFPFAAHAWVECGSRIPLQAKHFGPTVSKSPSADLDLQNGFVPIARIG